MRKLMVTSEGSYRDPADKHCFSYCHSCGRCENKDRFNCGNTCSGRLDKLGMRKPDIDDYCRCKEGILQWTTQEGQFVQVRYQSSPFAGVVKYDNIGQDEADWNQYLADTRERLNDPTYDPIQFDDGSSVEQYLKKGSA